MTNLLSDPTKLLEALARQRRQDPRFLDLLWTCMSSPEEPRGGARKAAGHADSRHARQNGGRASSAGGVCLGFVPGRIEVLGRHTDYAGGRSLVCAIDRGFSFAARPTRDGTVRLREDTAEFEPVQFPLSPSLTPRRGHWANYPMTMARRVARNFGGDGRLRGADIVFSSTMPVGSGMSGSSALMMMVFTALAVVNGLPAHFLFRKNIKDPVDLSMYLACAENGQSFHGLDGDKGVGTFGGSEDHAGILNGRAGKLSLFRFGPSVLLAEPSWPRDWRLVVAFSGVRAEKTREALAKYNLVSRRVREAVAVFNASHGTGFVTLREVVEHASATMKGTAWLKTLDSASRNAPSKSADLRLADRVRQFILEDATHIEGALAALKARDIGAFGRMITASHRASRMYLRNIVPEIDWLAASALRLGAEGASVFAAAPGPGIQVWRESGPVRLVDLFF